MKYVILRCEDRGWAAGTPSLVEGAKTIHLRDLFQAGAGGLIRSAQGAVTTDRFALHRGLLGLSAQEPSVSAGLCYAASARTALADGETAWCAELLTQHDGKVTDATAGGISTKESRVLIDALSGELAADTRRWVVGEGSHHVLVVREPFLQTNGTAMLREPEALVGQSWRRGLPRGPLRDDLRMLIERASKVLEAQAVNRVRADLGENPANLLWLWGAAARQSQRTFRERTGLSGAVASNGFAVRGLAEVLGLAWQPAPASFSEAAMKSLPQTMLAWLQAHDAVYAHLEVRSAAPVERLVAMERLDQLVLKPLTARLPAVGDWRLLVVLDDPARRVAPFMAIGAGLSRQPIAQLTADHFAESPLVFPDGLKLFSWFTAR